MKLSGLSAAPTRAECRTAAATLRLLAGAGVPGAAEELTAVESLLNTDYPRGGCLRQARKPARARARGLITAADCQGRCTMCLGRKTISAAWVTDKMPCPKCGATGIGAVGAAEHVVDEPGSPFCRLRGDLAQAEFTRPPTSRPTTCLPHSRGFVGGRFVGQDPRNGHESWRYPAGFDAIDIEIDRQARAERKLRELRPAAPRGKKKGSRRDRGILTPGQQVRAKMSRRVRLYQRIADAMKRRAQLGMVERADPYAVFEQMGMDVGQLRAQVKAEQLAHVVDTFTQPTPQGPLYTPSFGEHAGKRGAIVGPGRMALRSDGSVQREGAVRMVFEDGSVDVLSRSDLVAVA